MKLLPFVLMFVVACATLPVAPPPPERVVEDMALAFLRDFTNSNLPTQRVMRNFDMDTVGGRSEWDDTVANRVHVVNRSVQFVKVSTFRATNGACPYRHVPAEMCVQVDVRWVSTFLDGPFAGRTGIVYGMDQIGAAYKRGRWWLVSSDWRGYTTEPVWTE